MAKKEKKEREKKSRQKRGKTLPDLFADVVQNNGSFQPQTPQDGKLQGPEFSSPTLNMPDGVMGKSIAEITTGGTSLPKLLKDAIEFIEGNGRILTVGLYRNGAVVSKVNALVQNYCMDASKDFNLHAPNLFLNVNTVCSAVKGYLRALPEPMIPEKMLSGLSTVEEPTQTDPLASILARLSCSNLFLLRELCHHWNRISQHAESANKMTAHNLAICLAPTVKIPLHVLEALIKFLSATKSCALQDAPVLFNHADREACSNSEAATASTSANGLQPDLIERSRASITNEVTLTVAADSATEKRCSQSLATSKLDGTRVPATEQLSAEALTAIMTSPLREILGRENDESRDLYWQNGRKRTSNESVSVKSAPAPDNVSEEATRTLGPRIPQPMPCLMVEDDHVTYEPLKVDDSAGDTNAYAAPARRKSFGNTLRHIIRSGSGYLLDKLSNADNSSMDALAETAPSPSADVETMSGPGLQKSSRPIENQTTGVMGAIVRGISIGRKTSIASTLSKADKIPDSPLNGRGKDEAESGRNTKSAIQVDDSEQNASAVEPAPASKRVMGTQVAQLRRVFSKSGKGFEGAKAAVDKKQDDVKINARVPNGRYKMRQKSMSTDELKSPGKENDASGSDDETEASEPQPRVNGTLSRAGPANENEQITCASISSSSSSKVNGTAVKLTSLASKPLESTSRPKFELLDEWERRIEKNRSDSVTSIVSDKIGATKPSGEKSAQQLNHDFSLEKQWGFGDLI